MLDLELEIEVVADIVDLHDEDGQELHVLLSETPRVAFGYFHLLLRQYTSSDGDYLRCEGIGVV